MGTGWRRAFCTSIRRDSDMAVAEKSPDPNRSRRSCTKLTFFSGSSGSSNPSTPRLGSLRCRTKSTPSESPKLQRKTATVESPRTPPPPTIPKRSPTLFDQVSSNPSSPRSRSTFALFKAAVHFSRIRCGICERSVKAGRGTAVFTAECSHVFHFPCIAAHVRTHGGGGTIGCPVCSAAWCPAPFLSSLGHLQDDEPLPPVLVGDRKPLHYGRMSSGDEQCGSEAEDRPVSAAAVVKKVYDDDEPLLLLSAKPSHGGAGCLFHPIPEADEDDESGGNENDEGEEEFHEFLAKDNNNSSRPRSPCHKVTAVATRACAGGLQVRMMPEAALVSSGRRHRNYVVALKVKAPAVAPLLSGCRRAPIDLVTVLDVSGGMTGAKIQMLKRAMRLVISSLGPADRLSLVAFSAAAAKRLLPLRRMSRSGQRSAWQIVERLVASTGGQGSCVGDALRKATKVLEDRRERNTVATIMLLSDVRQQQDAKKDGPNCRRYPSTAAAAAATMRFAHLEVPIHEICFGDAPQQRLPRQSSSQEATVEDAFAKCVGGLVSVVMQDVLLQLFFPSGEVSAVYSCGAGRAVALASSVRLGDLYAEEERELLVELRVPTAAGPDHHQHSLSVKCRYRDPATQEVVCGSERSLLLPLLQGQGHPQLARSSSSSSISLRLRNLFVTTRAVAESRRLADLSDYATALHLLSSARSLLLQSRAAPDQDRDLIRRLEAEISDLQRRREGQQQQQPSSCQRRRETAIPGGEQQLTPTSAWRAAEQLAKVAIMRKSLNRLSDLHGFENARF